MRPIKDIDRQAALLYDVLGDYLSNIGVPKTVYTDPVFRNKVIRGLTTAVEDVYRLGHTYHLGQQSGVSSVDNVNHKRREVSSTSGRIRR